MQFVSDQTIQFIITAILEILAVLIALAALTIQIISFKKQALEKEINFDIVENRLLSTPGQMLNDEEINNSMHLSFNNKMIKNMRRVIIRVWNPGNIHILDSDYITPITFNFEKGSEILHAMVVKTEPTVFEPGFNTASEKITLKPPLLNSGERIELKILVTESKGNVSEYVRFAGGIGGKQIVRSYKTELIHMTHSLSKTFLFTTVIFSFTILATQIISFLKLTVQERNTKLLLVSGLSLVWIIPLWLISLSRLRSQEASFSKHSHLLIFLALLFCAFLLYFVFQLINAIFML